MGDSLEYSLIIPVYNEEDSIAELVMSIQEVMDGISSNFEIIFIDDGSKDNSKSVIKELILADDKIKLIELRRNFGKATALNEGFKLASGEIVITMDSDLQDDPKEIPKLLAKLDEGNDLVSGWKEDRQDPLEKRLPSKLFNRMTGYFTKLDLHDFNCGFKVYRREVIKNIDLYGEMHRYIPALAHWKGFKVDEVAVNHHPRKHGSSKYGFERYLRGLFDFLTIVFLMRYSQRPMHFFGKIGLIMASVGIIANLYLSILWLVGESIGNRPLLILGVLLIIIGVQFFSTGLIGEMFVNINAGKEKHRHIVKEVFSKKQN